MLLGVQWTMELLEARGVRGGAADTEVEGMMPFVDVALDHMGYALVLEANVAVVECMEPPGPDRVADQHPLRPQRQGAGPPADAHAARPGMRGRAVRALLHVSPLGAARGVL